MLQFFVRLLVFFSECNLVGKEAEEGNAQSVKVKFNGETYSLDDPTADTVLKVSDAQNLTTTPVQLKVLGLL